MSDFELETRVSEPNLHNAPFVSSVTGTEYGVDVRFENRSMGSLSINWPAVEYIDEYGHRHAVVAYEGGGLPLSSETPRDRTRIESGSSRFYSVAAKDKVRFERVSCRRSTTIYYPIVPWERVDMTTGLRMVTDLASRKKEVAFVFPITADSRDEKIVVFLRPVLLPPEARTQTAE